MATDSDTHDKPESDLEPKLKIDTDDRLDRKTNGDDGAYPLYFDYNATTPVAAEVFSAMEPYFCREFGNPSSAHPYGARARRAVEQARTQVAALLGCAAEEVIFTSGGTESNNLAIRGTASLFPHGHVVTSQAEHPATQTPCWALEQEGHTVTRVAVDQTGRVAPKAVVDALRGNTFLVTLMLANNETGTLMPIAEIAREAKKRNISVHSDAAQAVGKIPVDVNELGVDFLSVAGHKLYAPKGVGALYVRRGAPAMPFMLGAGHENGLRPGTENVASIVGLGAACALARRALAAEPPGSFEERLRALRDRLRAGLQERIPDLALNGHPTERLPNTLNVRFPGVRSSHLLARTPEIAASTGSACHEGGDETPSAVLTAMGLEADAALSAVRLSLGRETTAAQVDTAIEVLTRAYRQLRS